MSQIINETERVDYVEVLRKVVRGTDLSKSLELPDSYIIGVHTPQENVFSSCRFTKRL